MPLCPGNAFDGCSVGVSKGMTTSSLSPSGSKVEVVDFVWREEII